MTAQAHARPSLCDSEELVGPLAARLLLNQVPVHCCNAYILLLCTYADNIITLCTALSTIKDSHRHCIYVAEDGNKIRHTIGWRELMGVNKYLL